MVCPCGSARGICLSHQAAPGVSRTAGLCARDVRVLADACPPPSGRCGRCAGRHGRRRRMVGARGRARAQRFTSLFRRLADRFLPRADLFLQRPRAPHGRRDGVGGRRRRAWRPRRRHVGRDRAFAPVWQRLRRPDFVVCAARGRGDRAGDCVRTPLCERRRAPALARRVHRNFRCVAARHLDCVQYDGGHLPPVLHGRFGSCHRRADGGVRTRRLGAAGAHVDAGSRLCGCGSVRGLGVCARAGKRVV